MARNDDSWMTAPSITIVFAEEPEDNYPETCGLYDTTTRHTGGSNFVMGDGHVEWVAWNNFCRSGNSAMGPCPTPLGQIQWDQSGVNGDWKAVEELTANLRQFAPEDPVKYDFALFGLGVFEHF